MSAEPLSLAVKFYLRPTSAFRVRESASVIAVIVMQSTVIRFTVWLFAEIVLTALGTDDLADYCEYLFKAKDMLPSQQSVLSEYICVNGVCMPKSLAFKAFEPSVFSV